MGEATAGKDTKVVAMTASSGSGTGGVLNKSDIYGASSSDEVAGCNNLSAPNGYNALDSTDFGDVAENVILGMKSGNWTLEGNYNDLSPTALETLEDAFDQGNAVEVGFIVDETVGTSSDAKGYEMTVFVTDFNLDSEQSGKVEFSITVQCSDGDGWNRLQ